MHLQDRLKVHKFQNISIQDSDNRVRSNASRTHSSSTFDKMGILDKNGSLSKENFLTFLEHFQEDFPKIRNVKKLENIFLFIYA